MKDAFSSGAAYIATQLSLSGRDLFDIVFSLSLATAMTFVISQVYRFTHRGMTYERSFMTALVSLGPIVSVVMLFIRGDLVLSLGLIGSLSIIRFRTPIKDTRDMVFLFWVISVGLGCGTFNWIVVILSTAFVVVIMFAVHLLRYGASTHIDFVLVVVGDEPPDGDAVERAVSVHAKEARLRSKEVDGPAWESVFEVRLKGHDAARADALVSALRTLGGVRKVSLLAPQIAMPV